MRRLSESFVAAPAAGAAMRTRLRVTDNEHALLCEVGDFLAGLRLRDLRRLCDHKAVRPGQEPPPAAERRAARNARKRDLTKETSARIAGSIMSANNDEWQLAHRNLKRRRDTLEAQIRTLTKRVAVPAGETVGGVRGYRSEHERSQKRRRLQIRRSALRRVRRRIEERRVSICVGGKHRARRRHNLGAAQMSRADWTADWSASRRFLTFVGESGKPGGNDTLRVDPATGTVELNLPARFARRANVAGRRLFRFSIPAAFDAKHPLFTQWAERAAAGGSLRYGLRHDPAAKRGRGAWYLTVSWSQPPDPVPSLEELRGRPTLGIDVNAGWIAAVAVDAAGNPFGRPVSVAVPQQGPARSRAGQLNAALQALGEHALAHGCASASIENLNFADARDVGRETMGRGRRGKRFRRQVANMPTAKFAGTIVAMFARAGIAVIGVDPAYTSKWGSEHDWRETLNCSEDHRCSSHHGAAVVIGRRGLGLAARRSKAKQSIGRCSCPNRLQAVAGKTRATAPPSRGCWQRPQRTPPQPPRKRCQTGRAQPDTSQQRNATPFGVAQRSPPCGVGVAADG